MTSQELLEETASHYNLGNRGSDGKNCQYLSPNGKRCAIGRCFRDDEHFIQQLDVNEETGKLEVIKKPISEFAWAVGYIHDLDSHLKPQYRGIPIQVWSKLQSFHDNIKNWTEKGLSKEGEMEKLKIQNYISEYDL